MVRWLSLTVRSKYWMIELLLLPYLDHVTFYVWSICLIHFKSVHSSMYVRTLLPERPVHKPSYVHTQSTQMPNTNGVSCKECQTLHRRIHTIDHAKLLPSLVLRLSWALLAYVFLHVDSCVFLLWSGRWCIRTTSNRGFSPITVEGRAIKKSSNAW